MMEKSLKMIEPRQSEVLGARRHCNFMLAKYKQNVKEPAV
jgi:hypothetical protein